VITTQNILSCRPKENYPINVLNAEKLLMLKEIVIAFGAKIFERLPAI
jgi:hypothetical protein